MRSIKTHFGVIISLVALLFSVQFGVFINNLIKSYEVSIQNEYNIVLVAKNGLTLEAIKEVAPEVASIAEISTKSITNRLKDRISKENLENLNKNLPKFYSVKLSSFPDSRELEIIEEKLKNIGDLNRVEIFKKTHDDIFKILLLLKSLVYGFALLIVLLGLMLIYKQMRIWVYEHKSRIEIMDLFGASFIIKSGKLYRMALVDSVIATLIVIAFYLFLPSWELFTNTMQSIADLDKAINLPYDGLVLFGIAIVLSLIAVTLVMIESGSKKA